MNDEILWEAVVDATRATHDVLAELARDVAGAVAFVGRTALSRDFVVLKLEPEASQEGEEARFHLAEIRELDETVPAPRTQCVVCSASIGAWRGQCPACGSAIGTGGGGAGGSISAETLLAFYQLATADYDVLGELQQARGGPPVYVARVRGDDVLLALRLTPAGMQTGGQAGYAVDLLPLRSRGAPPAPASKRVPLDVAPLPGAHGGTATTASDRICPRCGSRFGPDVLFCPRDGSSLQPVVTGDDLVGQLIDDRYFVEKRLGEGGMGEVYIAQQVRTGRKCALKLMHRSLTQDGDAVGRFHREAASACAISHANVATIYDSGKTSDGRPYFAMEFVEGRSLSQVIREEGPLAPDRAADIARQIADGLAAAHDLEIVHRDLKPDNVMLGATRGGEEVVKLVDFGIAKPTNRETRGITRTGFILGTPQYMSPEQLRGDALDGRTDLYSLGCVLFEMLTGAVPFHGETTELVMMRRLTEPPPRARKINDAVPKMLDEITARLLAREPDERYGQAREVSAALAAARGSMDDAGGLPFGLSGWLGKRTPAAPQPSGRSRRRRITVTTDTRTPRTSMDPVPSPPLSPPIPVRAATPTRVAAAQSGSGAAIASAGQSSSRPRAAAVGASATGAPRTAGRGAPYATPSSRSIASRKRSRALAGVAGVLVVAAAVVYVVPRLTSTARQERSSTGRSDSKPQIPAVSSATPADSVNRVAGDTLGRAVVEPAAPTTSSAPNGRSSAGQNSGGKSSARTGAGPIPATSPGQRTATQRSVAAQQSGTQKTAQATPQGAPTASYSPSPASSGATPSKTDSPAPGSRTAVTTPGTPAISPESSAEASRAEERARDVIRQYVQAINDKDIDDIRRLYPTLEQRVVDGYANMFRDASDFSAQLSGPASVNVRGATAEADFAYVLKGHSPSMGNFRRPISAHATLQRSGQGWQIQTIGAAR